MNLKLVRGLLSFGVKGYLIERGWIQSYITKNAVDIENRPIPWLTYPFLDLINGRLDKSMSLFEYGSGNSTLYFSQHLGKVCSIEYDKVWFDKIKSQIADNVNIKYVDLEGDSYENAILNQNESFDIILIDGRKRVKCLKNAVGKLSERGVLILDDSERSKYKEGIDYILDQEFKHLPLSGIAIGSIHGKCTSIFYRKDNVLNI
ncbi:MAG: class I SAM-dependent methyltransferase [Chitinophagales bacterium]|nr:class I SAM-dependent methyltransferase [Chitinophagales bacterium]